MLRIVLIGLSIVVAWLGGLALLSVSAQAQPLFKKYFDRKYFPMEGETAMKKAYESSSCNFCHIGGADDRKHRNDYGKALSKLGLKKEDAANLTKKVETDNPVLFKKTEAKVINAIDDAEKEHSDPKDKSSPTFGDLLKEGKLPKSPATLP
jgi:hypothetical protein